MPGKPAAQDRLQISTEAASGLRCFLAELPAEYRDQLRDTCDRLPIDLPPDTFAVPDLDDPANAQDCYRG